MLIKPHAIRLAPLSEDLHAIAPNVHNYINFLVPRVSELGTAYEYWMDTAKLQGFLVTSGTLKSPNLLRSAFIKSHFKNIF